MSESDNQPVRLKTSIKLSPPTSKYEHIIGFAFIFVLFLLLLFNAINKQQWDDVVFLFAITPIIGYWLFSTPTSVEAGHDGILFRYWAREKLIPWSDIYKARIVYWRALRQTCIIRYGPRQRIIKFSYKRSSKNRSPDWLHEVIAYQADLRLIDKGFWGAPIYRHKQEVG